MLDDPRLGLDTIINRFLPACRAAAEAACRRDQYAGFQFTDIDGARVRWNPVRTSQSAVTSSKTKININIPVALSESSTRKGSKVRIVKRWLPATPNGAGDYPVDLDKLKRMVAPCLTHTLDSAFAGFVVKALKALGVRDVVSIHDCWMVASDATPALYEAISAAGEPWLRSLGPVYVALRHYLDDDPTHGPWLREIEAAWAQRVTDAEAGTDTWPHFLTSPACQRSPNNPHRWSSKSPHPS